MGVLKITQHVCLGMWEWKENLKIKSVVPMRLELMTFRFKV